MSQQFTFKATTKVWITCSEYGYTHGELVEMVEAGNQQRAVNSLGFSNAKMNESGWIEMGSAELTITLNSADEVTGKHLESLNAELQEHRVRAHIAEQAILARISKLQALTYEVPA